MAVPQFIEFAQRIVNVSRIVTVSPPRMTAEGIELECRIDGNSYREHYRDEDEAELRYEVLKGWLLDEPPPVSRTAVPAALAGMLAGDDFTQA